MGRDKVEEAQEGCSDSEVSGEMILGHVCQPRPLLHSGRDKDLKVRKVYKTDSFLFLLFYLPSRTSQHFLRKGLKGWVLS